MMTNEKRMRTRPCLVCFGRDVQIITTRLDSPLARCRVVATDASSRRCQQKHEAEIAYNDGSSTPVHFLPACSLSKV